VRVWMKLWARWDQPTMDGINTVFVPGGARVVLWLRFADWPGLVIRGIPHF